MHILIIADDLSGAADCAIGFACAGHRTLVAVQPFVGASLADGAHLAVDIDSRRLPPAEAAQRAAAAYSLLTGTDRRLYKKIDSTLRGNWAAEVAGLVPLAGLALVAPAHPALGRTVKQGRVFVHGVPIERTETWLLEHSHRPAGIAAQLRESGLSVATLRVEVATAGQGELAARIDRLADQKVNAIVFDAETLDELRCLASATLSMKRRMFWVGSGGLAREIAGLLSAGPVDAADVPSRASGPTLIVAGSLSAVTDRQTALLAQQDGVQTIVVPPAVLRDGASSEAWIALQARIDRLFDSGVDVLLKIGRDARIDPSEGARLSTALARLTVPAYARIGGLIATGGETARALLVEAGVDGLRVLDELEPGVVVGVPTGAAQRHPWVVTKAGAFGNDETLLNAWRSLRVARAGPSATPLPRADDAGHASHSPFEEHH
jgi:uncharacterized protein YgbK (DUF1537 family)